MKKVSLAIAGFVIALSISLLPSAMAQGLFGTISGLVTDSTGAVIAGATVKVTNINTSVSKTLITNSAGVYNATSLNPDVIRWKRRRRASKPQS